MRAAFLAMAAVVLVAPAAAGQGACPGGRALSGDIGVERYRCVGGACEIWASTSAGLAHVFTTEPRIDAVDEDGAAAGRLEIGDALVAVDELLITTPAAGRRLASLEPGRAVRLWVRRDGRDVRLEVVPQPGCGPSGLSVRLSKP